MKERGLFVIIIVVVLCFSFPISSVWAGNVQRNRWEGVAIGVGAVVLGKMLWAHHRDWYHSYWEKAPKYYTPAPSKLYDRWEMRKIWVPPTYKKVWRSGHYNYFGQWIPGKWITTITVPGHWDFKRVWVTNR